MLAQQSGKGRSGRWRAGTEHPDVTILIVDGVAAYEPRVAVGDVGEVPLMPAARSLLSFVRMSCVQTSSCQLLDARSEVRSVI